MGEGERDVYHSSVAVNGGGGDKIPGAGRKIGASLEVIAQAWSGGKTDDGLAVAQADGKRRRNQRAEGDGEVGAVLEEDISIHGPEGDLIFARAIHGEGAPVGVVVAI